jgi:CheY-like chemotaxis protein
MVDTGIPASVLLVDDNPAKLMALEAALVGLDLELVTAASGTEALRHLLEQEFAVVLLDVNMPILDGFETAALIRSRPRSEHLPIIFITAERLTDEARLRGYALGAVDYILSPVLPEILRAKVKAFADLYRLRYLFRLQFELGNIGIAVSAPDKGFFCQSEVLRDAGL